MRTFVIITALLSSLSCFSQKIDCLRFRNGTFEIQDEHGHTVIERKGNVQTEKMKGQDYKSTLRVKWLDECTYTLKPTKRTRKRSGGGIPSNAVLTVTIIEVKSNSYIQSTISNFFDFTYTSEMKKID